jgi:polysaccharide pyruvyl transferase WcaK-like protein
MKKKLKVLIGGAPFGDKNFGEDAILATDIAILRRINPEIDITVLTDEPERTSSWLNVKAFPRGAGKKNPRFFQHLDLMSSTDIFAFGGTTMLSDSPNLPLRMIYFAKMLHKPVMTFPCGMNPIPSKMTRYFIQSIINKVDLFLARDEETKDLLLNYGVNIPLHVTADPVMTLQAVPGEDEKQKLLQENPFLFKDRPIAAICLAELWRTDKSLSIEEYIKTCNYLINDCGYSLFFFSTQSEDPWDLTFKVMEGVSKKDKCFFITKRYYPEQILTILQEIDLVISSRLHFLIPCALANVPLIGLSRGNKIGNFLKRIGMEPLGSVEKVKFEDLKNEINRVLKNKDTIRTYLKQKVDLLKVDALKSEIRICDFLHSL